MSEELTNIPTRRAERIGKYEILGHVATGGMGVVYKARDTALDRLVALKILPPDLAKNQTTLLRFKREAAAAAQLRHDNIVSIYDIGEINGTYYLALEFVEGTDLQDFINRQCKLDPKDARMIMIQATKALVHADEQRVIHRDIKPSNFLLSYKDGRLTVKLTDFGLAIRLEDESEFRLTKDRSTVGTVDYMSPEQATDSRAVDIRSDIYSLGCTFYHMLAGQAPFAKGSLPERIVNHLQTKPVDLRKHNKHVPKSFAAIIAKMLEKKPEDRYQKPADLLDDLLHPDRIMKRAKERPKLELRPATETGSLTSEIEKVEAVVKAEAPPKPEPAKPPLKGNWEDSLPVIELDKAPQAKAGKAASLVSEEEILLKPLPETEPPPRPKVPRSDPTAKVHVAPAPAPPPPPPPPPRPTKVRAEPAAFEEPKPEKAKKRPPTSTGPLGLYVAGGAVAMVALVMLFAIVTANRTPAVKKKEEPPPVSTGPRPIETTPIEPIDTSPNKMTVPQADLPLLDPSIVNVDKAELRKEFAGPFGVFPEVPSNPKVMRVARLAPTAPGTFRTVADAIAQTVPDEWTLIEIADNGPIYVPALPPLQHRLIVLRGAEGFHPLLAWDMPKKPATAKAPRTLLTMTDGSLILERLDIVVKCTDDVPLTLFELGDADFFARHCTFSLMGAPQREITLLRRRPPDKAALRHASRTWLKRCYVRGPELSLLDLRDSSTDLFVDESLIVGQQQPLIQMRTGDDDGIGFHCVRSSLVSSHVFLRWQAPAGKTASPRIRGRVLDSVVSRDDAKSAQGDMLHLIEEQDVKNVNWRAINSVYAGWKRLLASAQTNIAGNEIDAWRSLWKYAGPDHAAADAWPSSPPPGLEVQPALTFLPTAPVQYAAITSHGALGAAVGLLPTEPDAWIERVYDPGKIPSIPNEAQTPVTNTSNDGRYHGEPINLNKVDLGKHLSEKLRNNPAPRVVMYLYGRGKCPMSALRVSGVDHLVLVFKGDPNDPLTLELDPTNIAQRSPVIEMSDGHLELIDARFHLSKLTLVPHLFSIRDGSLTLTRCRLEGPITKSIDTFKSLITMSNPYETPATLTVRNSVLVCSKTLLHLRDNIQMRARNSVFITFDDAVQIDAETAIQPLTHLFDHNTFAAQHTILNLRPGKEFEAVGDVRCYATSNAFLRPFADDWDKGALLRGAEPWTALGRWHWQGRNNVYDGRLFAYFAPVEKLAAGRQTLADWQLAWGAVAEQESILYDGAPATKVIGLDTALQFDKLTLPPQLRGDPTLPPPGADLFGLRLTKKKG